MILSSNDNPVLLGIGTATPPSLKQEQTLEFAASVACATPRQQAWIERVFHHCGIQTRGSVLVDEDHALKTLQEFYPPPLNSTDKGPSTANRMIRYAQHAPALGIKAASRALAQSDISPQAITHLITVSCTGFVAPGLDVSLINSLDLKPDVTRLHVGFMGCHAAFNALSAAHDAVMADRNAKVLVCCVELCSLHLAYGWKPEQIVANALFADGASAVVIGHPPHQKNGMGQLIDLTSLLLPDSQDAMAWRIGDHGFEMTLSQSIPDIIRRNLRSWCEPWLAQHSIGLENVAGWAVHPGGPKILSAVADALKLKPSALSYSHDVLSRHGNMSSATVLFVLEQMIAQGLRGPFVAIGLGPGLMAEGMLLKC